MKHPLLHKLFDKGRVAIVTVFSFMLLGIMAFFTYNLSFLNPIQKAVKDFSMTDLFYQILEGSGHVESSPLITIVDMTELISRRDLAQALENIEACKPKVIGVDMVFEGRKEDELGDEMMQMVAARYDNIVWSMKLYDWVNPELEHTTATRSYFTENVEVKEGVTNMQRELYGGVKRMISLGWRLNGDLRQSFLGAVVNEYADKEVVPMASEQVEINFTPTVFAIIPADSVLEHPELIADHIVLFGAMNEEVDMHYTPLGKMAGIQLLAYGIQTLMNKKNVMEVKGFLFWVITFVLVAITYYFRRRRKDWIARRRHAIDRLLFGFPIVGSAIAFLWMALLMWVAFILFCGYNISFNLGFVFASIAFLGTAEDSYTSLLNFSKDYEKEKQ